MTGLFKVSSVEEIWELAAKLAQELKSGDVICLEGDLGAGKTTFTQGLCAALKLPGRVTSPTFCIVQEHLGVDRSLVHMDLYRLDNWQDVISVGWEDFLDRGDIIVVEWPERAPELIPQDARHIIFRHMEGEEERTVEFK